MLISESVAIIEGAPVPLREPQTREQKLAFINLMRWAADRIDAPETEIKKAVDLSKQGDWSAAIELVRDFYVMKGIRFKSN